MHLIMVESADRVMPTIKEALKAQGKTQRQLAEYMGWSEKHLHLLLKNEVGTPMANLYKMLHWLDIGLVLAPIEVPDVRV